MVKKFQTTKIRMDESDLLDLIGGLLANSNWFQIHTDFFDVLTLEQSMVLHFLLNWHLKKTREGKVSSNWFFCTVKSMEKELRLNPDQQTRVLKALQKKGFLEFRRKGIPPRRHIKFNSFKIYEVLKNSHQKRKEKTLIEDIPNDRDSSAIESWESPVNGDRGSSAVNKKYMNKNNASHEEDKSSSCSHANRIRRSACDKAGLLDDSLIEKTVSTIKKLAEDHKLSNQIIRCRRQTIKERIIELTAQFSSQEIFDTFTWYRHHYQKSFVPKLHEISDITEKFSRVRDAMRRPEDKKSNKINGYNGAETLMAKILEGEKQDAE